MNRYQSQFNKEIKQLMRDGDVKEPFKKVRRVCKIWLKLQMYPPCENCDNPYCKLNTNKIYYCRDNR